MLSNFRTRFYHLSSVPRLGLSQDCSIFDHKIGYKSQLFSFPYLFLMLGNDVRLRIPSVLKRRKELRLAFILVGDLKKIFSPSFGFYGDMKNFLGISIVRFKILPLSQHIRHMSYNCLTFRSYFAKKASISFLISSYKINWVPCLYQS